MKNKTVYIQNWDEYERGWGSRSDGFTVHLNKKARDEYVAWYTRTFNNMASAPDEYTTVSGDGAEVTVSDELYAKIEKQLGSNKRSHSVIHGRARYWDYKDTLASKDLQLD